jgi:TonB-dependent receptor
MDTFKLWDKPFTIKEQSASRAGTFNVTEDTLSEFVQVDFKTEIAGMPFRGDFGVRHFNTDQESTAWFKKGGTWDQKKILNSYSDTLPSLNLVLEPITDVQVRASYSEGIARANPGQLTGDINVTVTGTNRTVTINNPYLVPSKAKSYDLGVEWYFDEEAAISFGIFYKDVDTFVQTIPSSQPLTNLTNLSLVGVTAEEAAKAACAATYNTAVGACNENTAWAISEQANAPGGAIKGYELTYQQPFTFLPGFWSNFGFIGSFTHVDADLDYATAKVGEFKTGPLLQLSPNSSSATIYYEQDAFKARVSVAQRDDYLTLAVLDQNGNDQNGTYGTTNVDAQISYEINEHFKVTLDALNLTNELDDQWVDATDKRLSYVHETGRQFNLGVNYKF